MKLTIALITLAVALGLALPLSANELRNSAVSPTTAQTMRDAERTLLTVSTWRSTRTITFDDDARREELFNLHSKTQRLMRMFSVLNTRRPLKFYDEYAAFANELSRLRNAVVLKSEWRPLLGGVIDASADALRALQHEANAAYNPLVEASRLGAAESPTGTNRP